MGPAERPPRSSRQACARGRPARAAVGTPCPFETLPHRASEVRSITSASLRGASRTRGLTWRLLTCWAPATSVASAPEETDYYGCTRPYTPVRGRTYARVRRLAHDAVTTSRQGRSAHGRWPRDHVIEISPSHGEPGETGLRRHSGHQCHRVDEPQFEHDPGDPRTMAAPNPGSSDEKRVGAGMSTFITRLDVAGSGPRGAGAGHIDGAGVPTTAGPP